MDQPVAETQSLYAKQQKIHAREVTGFYTRLRLAAAWLLLGIYYVVPWLRWDSRQAILFDLPARKFYIFGMTLWPQDFVFLAGLLIMAALLLFFATAMIGRVWCGYACPQTVWTEAFVWMERLVEGKFSKRAKLDRGPWNSEKILRKTAKQVLWISFSIWTGFTFVGYFTPITTLAGELVSFQLGAWQVFWIGFYSFATYGNAGYLREQVCKYMCPYARFQSAMFDRDTLIVSYDEERGEPRGSRKRGKTSAEAGKGDCIDCSICVQVCPTGIDIRKGLQYECITCALCVDACDSVMAKMEYPPGLIRYTTQNALEGKPSKILRPRVFIYGALLTAIAIGFLVGLVNRPMMHVDVMRDRNALYRELPDGRIENVFTLKILSKLNSEQRLVIAATGLEGLEVDTGSRELVVGAGEVINIPARVKVRRDAVSPGGHDIQFEVTSTSDSSLGAVHEARFFGPTPRQ